ncbi:MAG TPA: hypothetical protein VFZ89_13935 [Solirubrobacteraceae bacterium]
MAVSTATGASSDEPPSGPISAADVARQVGTPSIPVPPAPPPPPPGTPPPPPPPGTPPPPPPPATTTGPVPTVAGVVTATDIIKLPSSRRCVRRIRVVLARRSGIELKGLAIRAGARVIVRRSTPTVLTIRVLPRKRFRLKVTVRANGRSLTRTRSYQPCRRR